MDQQKIGLESPRLQTNECNGELLWGTSFEGAFWRESRRKRREARKEVREAVCKHETTPTIGDDSVDGPP